MPLWSTSSSSTSSINPTSKKPSLASSSSKPPQLPPLGPFTPPSDSLPHFLSQHHRRSSSSSTTTTTTTTTTTKSKFKGKETFKEDFEDDPWQDGSDDELTVKKLEIATTTTTTQHVEPTQSVTTSPTTGSTGGGGWFASLTGNAFASSSSSSTPTSTTTPATTKSKVLRRQASAKDVAAALSPSNSPSFNSKPPPLPETSNFKPTAGVLKRGGSYIVGVNAVQEEAVQIVKEEIRRSSIENGSELVNEAESLGNAKEDGVENKEGREGSEKDRLRKCIRGDIYELVKDPTSVLPRLRTEWLGRVPSPSSSFSPAAAPPITPSSSDDDPSRRASISSLAEDGPDSSRLSTDSDGGPPKGYAPLNASSLSSSTTKKIVDYQKEYSSRPPDPLEAPGEIGRDARRRKKFLDVLQGVRGDGEEEEVRVGAGETDLGELRKLSWGGVTRELRPVVWSLLLGYLPSPFSRREVTLARKRKDYSDMVKLAFSRGVKGLDGPIWHQISIDVPRTRPGVKLWMMEGTQRSLERILYVWAIRHPASGYVQGINDLVTPFFQVFLGLYINSDPEEFDPALLPPEALEALEADSFWCLSKLLDGIQDNYIFAQPGITRAVKKMELLCKRVDAPLAKHLESEGVEFIQFAFRWMNCLLMRELSVENIVRMWDTYLAEGGDAFSEFHLYVCLSFLVKWSEQLRTMDFQSIIMFLQSLPTKDWKDGNTELLLSEAFMWSRTFEAR